MHHQPAGADDLPDAADQRGVADVLRRRAEDLPGLAVAQRDGLHRRLHRDGRLQQVGMEGQHLRPGAGGALREDRHRIALAQGLGHLVHHPQRVALALALDEQRADVADQPAQQRPAQHIRLGDEARLRAARMDAGDVQPGHMVGDEQRGAGRGVPCSSSRAPIRRMSLPLHHCT
jgi:hypothetical protein